VHRLTAKRERFCLEMVKPRANQSKAYRVAFNAQDMKASTIHREACILMKDPKITARIAELRQPALDHVQGIREEWVLDLGKVVKADIRKMFDSFGSPINIKKLGDNEAAIIEAFEVFEHYAKVKNANGETEAVLTSRTTRYKVTPRLKALLEFGEVMGWFTEKKESGLDATLEELVLGSIAEGRQTLAKAQNLSPDNESESWPLVPIGKRHR
jgi:hypothetical protein